jgi:hypothetical protein
MASGKLKFIIRYLTWLQDWPKLCLMQHLFDVNNLGQLEEHRDRHGGEAGDSLPKFRSLLLYYRIRS